MGRKQSKQYELDWYIKWASSIFLIAGIILTSNNILSPPSVEAALASNTKLSPGKTPFSKTIWSSLFDMEVCPSFVVDVGTPNLILSCWSNRVSRTEASIGENVVVSPV